MNRKGFSSILSFEVNKMFSWVSMIWNETEYTHKLDAALKKKKKKKKKCILMKWTNMEIY